MRGLPTVQCTACSSAARYTLYFILQCTACSPCFSSLSRAALPVQAVGRTYEEDFNNFHDHEHWPGLCLLLIRLGYVHI